MALAHKSIDILASDLDLDDDDNDPDTAMVPEELDKPVRLPSPPATVAKVQKWKHQENGMPTPVLVSIAIQTQRPMLISPSIMSSLIVELLQCSRVKSQQS
ncbi:uncharacterized protein LACBIDRAFT_304629 [Laccaria bicolor S238N-H82]|uniref:Predicted protein n=1 Tax=Laccaria bicolor (strain S238N-H82 / ATCC MYA-4686) TaxID=486041 RepID=B0DM16_LACBS|nr:uncharacterized protein LACBIDRAFT_304629 [Laccaria bicolor S238N-H82]EDR04487.1 predicted protein [Laccaria bicolor S238N-H82]|eukprot:XP_001885006.1 predicted protein [Laccaria bicolor S238N-H82]